MNSPADSRLTLVGRSSSHFTRVTRLVAAELAVPHAFRVVRDLSSREASEYAGNPSLKVPILVTENGTWFGSLNICRELWRRSSRSASLVWPEQLETPRLANAQELVLQAMANGVTLIMSKVAQRAPSDADAFEAKVRSSLQNSLTWLEANIDPALAELPASRSVSYLEVTLFCLVRHLEFREICSVSEFANLLGFCDRFGARDAAKATEYRFD